MLTTNQHINIHITLQLSVTTLYLSFSYISISYPFFLYIRHRDSLENCPLLGWSKTTQPFNPTRLYFSGSFLGNTTELLLRFIYINDSRTFAAKLNFSTSGLVDVMLRSSSLLQSSKLLAAGEGQKKHGSIMM